MPVLITGATGLVGRALATRLLAEGGQVRAYVRRDDAELRTSGVHVAIGAADDVPRLESALTRVHTLVHLVGGEWPARGTTLDALNRDTTEAAVIAAHAADVRRIVFLSFPGAHPGSPNEFLAAKGRAEEHVRASGLEFAIIRPVPTLEWFARLFARARRGRAVVVPGGGRQQWNPVALTDLVDAIVAADARDAAVHDAWDLGGPGTMTLAEIARAQMPGLPLTRSSLLSGLPAEVTDLLRRETVVDPARAVEHLGLRLTPVR